jgi:Subtilase family
MRHAQSLLVHLTIAVQQEIEVDRARPVALARPDATQIPLDREQPVEECPRLEVGGEPSGSVDEPGLVEDAYRVRLPKLRNLLQLDAGFRGEQLQRPLNVRLTVAEIRTDTDEDVVHVAAIFSVLNRVGVLSLALISAALAWPATGAPATLGALDREEVRAHPHALVLARSERAKRAVRRAGGRRVAYSLPIWRLESRAALRLAPLAELVEPDRFAGPTTHLTTGDPLRPSQWWIGHVGADRAEPPGPGKRVTVIDTGVDLGHPEFAGRPETRALNGQAVVGQFEEHGTAVASVAAAPANGIGVVGVYPQVSLQVWDASPSGSGIRVGDMIAGIDAAIRSGPSVISLSLGTTARDPLVEAIVAVAFGSGSLVVAAAGNDRVRGSPLEYPASFPHVLTVGATDHAGRSAGFSSVSPYVDLAAPGLGMPVAVPMSANPTGYDSLSGTSFSAPLVAGAAAWVWTARPSLDTTQLFELMRASARDIESPRFDPLTGFGILDIPGALRRAPLARDPSEPNDDVAHVKPRGLFRQAAPPLNSPGRLRGALSARLEFAEDPRDVYRVWVPGRRVTTITLAPNADADLALWGPRTFSVFEGGAARKRDLRGFSERSGTRRETVRVRNVGRRGSYYYVEAYAGMGRVAPLRRIGGIGYRLSVTTAALKRARR